MSLILGIESSCDETAASLVSSDRRILAHRLAGQESAHRPFGGVVPEIAARAHVEILPSLIEDVLAEAGLEVADVDAIAATAGPGLIGGVMVGLVTAKGLALASGKPLVAVNHLEAHALSPMLSEPDLDFPYLLLLVSGGHCQLLRVEGFVEVMPRKGTRVAHITLADLREVYQAITALEVESVVLAATRKPDESELAPLRKAVADMRDARPGPDPTRWIKCDERFHRGLLTLSGNRRIEQVGLGLRDYAQRAHIVASRLRPIPVASEQSHGELIDLIAAGKVETARRRHAEQRRIGEVALIGAMERAGIRAL